MINSRYEKHQFDFLALLFFIQLPTLSDSNQILEDIQENLEFGNISMVIQIADSLKKNRVKTKKYFILLIPSLRLQKG